MSSKHKYHPNIMLIRIKYHLKSNFIPNQIAPKIKCHSKGNVTQIQCHSKTNVLAGQGIVSIDVLTNPAIRHLPVLNLSLYPLGIGLGPADIIKPQNLAIGKDIRRNPSIHGETVGGLYCHVACNAPNLGNYLTQKGTKLKILSGGLTRTPFA